MKAYVLSSSLIGCLGGIEAYWLTYIIPDDVFNVMRTIQMVIMTLLGGHGNRLGPRDRGRLPDAGGRIPGGEICL